MALIVQKCLNSCQCIPLKVTVNIHTTFVNYLDQDWRKKQRLESNPNSYGVLTNLPDYSYLNGKATPLGVNQKKRIVKQKELAIQVIKMSKELDFAVTRHAKLKQQEVDYENKIIANKLKPKGHLLNKKL